MPNITYSTRPPGVDEDGDFPWLWVGLGVAAVAALLWFKKVKQLPPSTES